jgi:hypothetical protein
MIERHFCAAILLRCFGGGGLRGGGVQGLGLHGEFLGFEAVPATLPTT